MILLIDFRSYGVNSLFARSVIFWQAYHIYKSTNNLFCHLIIFMFNYKKIFLTWILKFRFYYILDYKKYTDMSIMIEVITA